MRLAAEPPGGENSYAIGLWGDMPYSTEQATVGVPNMISDMNSQNLAFTAHDGDLKESGPCDAALYNQALGYFNSLNAPAVFTPGDNDWTDCDEQGAVSMNSLDRLDYERKVFFNTSSTMGRRTLVQEVQSTPLCKGVSGSVPCVENRRWTVGSVTYATLNIAGTCNNLCGVAPDPAEFQARNAADIAWMQQTFEEAKQKGSAAVMLISQANPSWNRDPATLAGSQPDGFQAFLSALRDQVIAFKKPVVYVHGDSHTFTVDKPFVNAQGAGLENFTRLQTFGDHPEFGNNQIQWVKVNVDPKSREVFSFQPQIVPGNRVAVPAT
ncbi:MAG: hypothetical protein J2P43_04705 [Candidatus Dormibacteraeota bacterium]|nr:hypothetical protein [Candidatus Dormibacteraeota bacterium]